MADIVHKLSAEAAGGEQARKGNAEMLRYSRITNIS